MHVKRKLQRMITNLKRGLFLPHQRSQQRFLFSFSISFDVFSLLQNLQLQLLRYKQFDIQKNSRLLIWHFFSVFKKLVYLAVPLRNGVFWKFSNLFFINLLLAHLIFLKEDCYSTDVFCQTLPKFAVLKKTTSQSLSNSLYIQTST